MSVKESFPLADITAERGNPDCISCKGQRSSSACLPLYALASFPGLFASQNAYSGTAALVDECNKNTVAAEHTGVSDGLVPKHQ